MTYNEMEKAILAFRDRMYKNPNGCKVHPVSLIAFALFGSSAGYPTCCILYFCELAWDDIVPPEEAKLSDRVHCPACLRKAKEPTDGR